MNIADPFIAIKKCEICKTFPRLKGKQTCGSDKCKSDFFRRCVVPDTDETRILK